MGRTFRRQDRERHRKTSDGSGKKPRYDDYDESQLVMWDTELGDRDTHETPDGTVAKRTSRGQVRSVSGSR